MHNSNHRYILGHGFHIFMKMRWVLILVSLFLLPVQATVSGVFEQRLISQCQSGNPKTIASFCEKHVQVIVDRRQATEAVCSELAEDGDLKQACYMALFFRTSCPQNQYIVKALKDAEFCRFLIQDPVIFEELAFSRKGHRFTLEVLYEIWKLEEKKLEGTTLLMALGAALSRIGDSNNDLKGHTAKCLEKYDFYKKSHEAGKLFSQFEKLKGWEMGMLFSHGRSVEDLSWGQAHSETKKNFTSERCVGVATSFVAYRAKNRNGVSVHTGGAFYDNKPTTLAVFVEYGGVCGAISTAAVGFMASRGVPGFTIGQPGHCAFMTKAADGIWQIGSNIFGHVWSSSGNHSPWHASGSSAASVITTLSHFQLHKDASRSNLYYELSKFSRRPENKLAFLEESVKTVPKHFVAWKELLAIKSKNLPLAGRMELAKQAGKAFANDAVTLNYLISTILPLNVARPEKYKICSLNLSGGEDGQAQEIYRREFVKCLHRDVPELQGKVNYDSGTKGGFFKKLGDYYANKNNKISSRMKNKTFDAFEGAMRELMDAPVTFSNLLNSYGSQIDHWENNDFTSRGNRFVKEMYQLAENEDIRAKLGVQGVKFAMAAKDMRTVDWYSRQGIEQKKAQGAEKESKNSSASVKSNGK